jgi:hypothetical protein
LKAKIEIAIFMATLLLLFIVEIALLLFATLLRLKKKKRIIIMTRIGLNLIRKGRNLNNKPISLVILGEREKIFFIFFHSYLLENIYLSRAPALSSYLYNIF